VLRQLRPCGRSSRAPQAHVRSTRQLLISVPRLGSLPSSGGGFGLPLLFARRRDEGEPMAIPIELRRRILRARPELEWPPPACGRLTLGWVFVSAGATALTHRAAVTAYFTKIGIPAPALLGPFVGAVELVGGALLLLGLGVRLASLPLLVTMVVA